MDGSTDIYGHGGTGNDKLIGGLHTNSMDLYGDDGDDKIWAINPEQRGMETHSSGSASDLYGGYGNDVIYGSDLADIIYGDFNLARGHP